MKVVPKIIKEVGFDFHWNVEKVWALNYPAEEIDIRELEWHFEIPFWSKKGGFYDLSPNDVISKPELFKEEYECKSGSPYRHNEEQRKVVNPRWIAQASQGKDYWGQKSES